MTAKEFCLQYNPNLRIESQIQGRIKGLKKKYYLVRELGATGYLVSGDTESKAWKNAKEYILIEQEKSN